MPLQAFLCQEVHSRWENSNLSCFCLVGKGTLHNGHCLIAKKEADRLEIRNNYYYDYYYYWDCDYVDCGYDCDGGCRDKLDDNLLDDNLLDEGVGSRIDDILNDMDLVDVLLDCILIVENNLNCPSKQQMLIQMGSGFDCSITEVSAPLRCPSQFFYFVPSPYFLQGNSDFLD